MRLHKFVIVLLSAITFSQISNAQNTALYFEGEEQIAKIVSEDPQYSSDFWTVEYFVQTDGFDADRVTVVYNEGNGSPEGAFDFGITHDGRAFCELNHQFIEDHDYEGELNDGQCHWVTYVYNGESQTLQFYIDGEPTYQEEVPLETDFSGLWLLGSNAGLAEESGNYRGLLDEVRFWTKARSSSDIQNSLAPIITVGQQDAIFGFSMLVLDNTDQVIGEAFGGLNTLYRGNSMSQESIDPEIVENPCLEYDYSEGDEENEANEYLPEAYGTTMQTDLSNCTAAGSPELLCNGNFEQFDPILYTVSSSKYDYKNRKALTQGTGTKAGQSDIVNWYALPNPNLVGNFSKGYVHVRGGLGDVTQNLSARLQQDYFKNTGYTLDWQSPSSDVMVSLQTSREYTGTTNNPGTWNNSTGHLVNEIDVPMQSIHSQHEFSVNYLGSQAWASFQPGKETWPIKIEFVLTGAGVPNYTIGSGVHTLPLFDQQTPQGWDNLNIIFNTPANPASYTHLEVITYGNGGKTTPQVQHSRQIIYLDDVSLKPVPVIPPVPGQWPQYIDTELGQDNYHRRIKADASGNVYVTGLVGNNQDPRKLDFGGNTLNTTDNSETGSFLIKYDNNGAFQWVQYYPWSQIYDFEFASNGDIIAVGATNGFDLEPNVPQPPTWPTSSINFIQSASNSVGCGSNTYDIWTEHSINALVMRINPSTATTAGNPISKVAYGLRGYEAAVDIEVIGSKAYIAINVNDQTYSRSDGSSGSCPTVVQTGGLLWGGTNYSSNSILEYDINGNAPIATSAYTSTSDFVMMDHNGNNLYAITNDKLVKVDVSTYAPSSQTLPVPSNGIKAASIVHVTSGGDVYLTYDRYNDENFRLEKRDGGTLGYLASKNYQHRIITPSSTTKLAHKHPMNVTSSGNDVYVAYAKYDAGFVNAYYAVEKLDPNGTFGNYIWQEVSSGSNVYFNDAISNGEYVNTDIVPINQGNDEFAVVGNFITQSASWTMQFGTKTVSGTNGSHWGNTFVTKFEDLGASAQYKRSQSTRGDKSDNEQSTLHLYPNPASNKLMVESNQPITQIKILNLSGKVIDVTEGESNNLIELNIEYLTPGVYMLQVANKTKVYVEKLVVK
ncbi:LamG-like jellyroll fold domain-containing protein [Owenweeksia hongkongensis]|uniref:LamG-like jellyroll fold domain-containing protein n=1 Tax=Owenweeksia hongkongensis TaxID=253245 RepID=UPI003A954DBD